MSKETCHASIRKTKLDFGLRGFVIIYAFFQNKCCAFNRHSRLDRHAFDKNE